jgi:hypothetical protein
MTNQIASQEATEVARIAEINKQLDTEFSAIRFALTRVAGLIEGEVVTEQTILAENAALVALREDVRRRGQAVAGLLAEWARLV